MGLLVCYAFGTVWFMAVYARDTGPISLTTALGWCVIPFIIPDLVMYASTAREPRRPPSRPTLKNTAMVWRVKGTAVGMEIHEHMAVSATPSYTIRRENARKTSASFRPPQL